MGVSLSVNTVQLDEFAVDMERLSRGEVVEVARPHFQKIGKEVLAKARANINSKSGKLSRGGRVDLRSQARGLDVAVRFTAMNKGFNYAQSIEFGRRGFGPKTAKVLRFTVGGETVFAKRVGPAPAQKFLERAFDESQGTIAAEMGQIEQKLAALAEGH